MASIHRGDRLGIVASTACALHCALGPALAATAGMFPLLGDERIELVLAVIACCIAVFALGHAWLAHRSVVPAAIGALGIATLLAVRHFEVELERVELIGSIAGSVLLIGAHSLNVRERDRAACCNADLERVAG